jgi:hypothetical protein
MQLAFLNGHTRFYCSKSIDSYSYYDTAPSYFQDLDLVAPIAVLIKFKCT